MWREPSIFTYSYDFRDKTVAQLESDGWTVDGNAYFDSNGYYCASDSYYISKEFDLSQASKITITSNMYIYSGSWSNGCQMGLSTGNKYVATATRGDTNNGYRGVYISYDGGWEIVRTNQYVINGDTVSILEVDMNTRVITATATNNGNTQIGTYTLPQTTIDGIMTATTGLFLRTAGNTAHRIKDIQVVIE